MTQPNPDDPNVDQFFDGLAEEYNEVIDRCFPRYREMLQTVVDYVPPLSARPRIVELGCGTGNLSRLILDRFPTASLTLVDISGDSLQVCRRLFGKGSSGQTDMVDAQALCTLQSDMRDLQFDNEHFDLIISAIAIHHLPSKDKSTLIRNCLRWLRPGGTLAFADQFRAATQYLHDLHISQWKQLSSAGGASAEEWEQWMQHQAAHDHHDTMEQHIGWLRDAGAINVDVVWRCMLWTIIVAQKPASTQ